MPPTSRTVRIGSAHGLHARPAKLFAQAAKDAGIPVTVALGDNQAAFFGSVRDEQNDLSVNYGTGSQISLCVNAAFPTPVLPLERRPYIEGRALLNGSALCGGRAYALLEKFIRAVREADTEQYGFLNALAEKGLAVQKPLEVHTAARARIRPYAAASKTSAKTISRRRLLRAAFCRAWSMSCMRCTGKAEWNYMDGLSLPAMPFKKIRFCASCLRKPSVCRPFCRRCAKKLRSERHLRRHTLRLPSR